MSRLVRDSGTLAVATTQTRGRAAGRRRPSRSAVRADDRRCSAAAPCAPSSLGSCDINILYFTTQIKHAPQPPFPNGSQVARSEKRNKRKDFGGKSKMSERRISV